MYKSIMRENNRLRHFLYEYIMKNESGSRYLKVKKAWMN